MVTGISTVPTPTWRYPRHGTPSPDHFLAERSTPTPCCSSTPNEVVIHLSTTLIIPDFARFYNSPIDSFRPDYLPLPDGSLVAPPVRVDLRNGNAGLVVAGALVALFAFHTVTAGNFIRIGRVKRKGLFYQLFLSQLLGLISWIMFIIPYFDQSVNCSIIIGILASGYSISFGFLVTGILGYKAYKCLNNARFILVVLSLFQISSVVFTVLDIIKVPGQRRLTGNCYRPNTKAFLPVIIFLQFFESLFICICFLYAVYKSHGLPAVRGRISVQLSLIDVSDEILESDAPKEGRPEITLSRRGWWDYVSDGEHEEALVRAAPAVPKEGFISNMRAKFYRFWVGQDDVSHVHAPIPRKQSISEEHPIPQPPRPPASRGSETTERSIHFRLDNDIARRPSSPVPSTISRLSRFIPRMALFREVMRDELCYTAFITATCVVIVILTLIGINSRNHMATASWTSLNWIMISILSMHSFARVIRRHEHEAILQHPSAWNPVFRNEAIAAEVLRHSRSRRPWSPVSIGSHPQPHRRIRRPATSLSETEDPFEDPSRRHVYINTTPSWISGTGFARSVGTSTTELSMPSPTPSVESMLRLPIRVPSTGTEGFAMSGQTMSMVDSDSAVDLPYVVSSVTPPGQEHSAALPVTCMTDSHLQQADQHMDSAERPTTFSPRVS